MEVHSLATMHGRPPLKQGSVGFLVDQARDWLKVTQHCGDPYAREMTEEGGDT